MAQAHRLLHGGLRHGHHDVLPHVIPVGGYGHILYTLYITGVNENSQCSKIGKKCNLGISIKDFKVKINIF